MEGRYLEALLFLRELPKYEVFFEVLEVDPSVRFASHFSNYSGTEYSHRAVDIDKFIYGD